MNATLATLALLTGLITGGIFKLLQVPIPAPPNIAGIMGIVGIYLGFKLIGYTNYSIDILGALPLP